ncbi:MAG: aminopeptidase [Candidatus Woesearchaeota archaeon]
MKNETFEKQTFYKRRSSWNDHPQKTVFSFAEEYKSFLRNAKTERESVKEIEAALKKKGFKDISKTESLKPKDKVYKIIRNRCILAAIIGKEPTFRIIGSHIDSPRLDLKPQPLYEDSSLAMLRSHYYGGIKKYNWLNIPLAMHAVIHTNKGKKEISIGEKDNEPKFIIPDLLPHLARDQMEKKMREAVKGEDLQIIVGNIPVDDENIKEKVKFQVLKLLNKRYDIIEKDFLSADISFVPAQNPVDIGFDESMIAAYGHDDHACVYTSLHALLETENPMHTALCFFADKEEIGSYGDTGAQSKALEYFMGDILHLSGRKERMTQVLEESKALSGDVTVAIDPIFKDVHDPSNASYLGYGVSVEKYGGAGGKYSTNDASSEYMNWFVSILDKKDINWQTGELGKIDVGGGGTIAMFMAKYGIEVIDVGPCVLGMHTTTEVLSKADVYSTYLAYKSFFEK